MLSDTHLKKCFRVLLSAVSMCTTLGVSSFKNSSFALGPAAQPTMAAKFRAFTLGMASRKTARSADAVHALLLRKAAIPHMMRGGV